MGYMFRPCLVYHQAPVNNTKSTRKMQNEIPIAYNVCVFGIWMFKYICTSKYLYLSDFTSQTL